MKVRVVRKAKWVFGWDIWGYLGTIQMDLGFWQWHIYFIFKEQK